jgi:hypothetical protein
MEKLNTSVKDYQKLQRELDAIKGKSETALRRIVSDARERVPGWVATEVTKVYNIGSDEIKPGGGAGVKKSAGTIKVQGDTIDTIQIVYRGRLLTPAHFGMKPEAPTGGAYTLKAKILKSGGAKTLSKVKKLTKKQRKNIGRNFTRQGTRNSPQSPYMLQSNKGGGYIPFQRREQPGKMDHVMRTISIPQMVSSKRTKDNIDNAIAEKLGKRIEHHLKPLAK